MEKFNVEFTSVVYKNIKETISSWLIERTLTEISSDAEIVGEYAFYWYNTLTSANFPLATTIRKRAFEGCTALTSVDLLAAVTYIYGFAFYNCECLTALLLRSETMVNLLESSHFKNTPIASGTGYIYVPSSLVATYQADSKWSTYSTQFRALEDYTVDGTITGELDPTKI